MPSIPAAWASQSYQVTGACFIQAPALLSTTKARRPVLPFRMLQEGMRTLPACLAGQTRTGQAAAKAPRHARAAEAGNALDPGAYTGVGHVSCGEGGTGALPPTFWVKVPMMMFVRLGWPRA